MKKKYILPLIEVIVVKQTMILCVSGDFGEDASEPAHSSEMVDFEEFEVNI